MYCGHGFLCSTGTTGTNGVFETARGNFVFGLQFFVPFLVSVALTTFLTAQFRCIFSCKFLHCRVLHVLHVSSLTFIESSYLSFGPPSPVFFLKWPGESFVQGRGWR